MGIRPLENMNDAFLTWLGDLFQNLLLCFPLFLQHKYNNGRGWWHDDVMASPTCASETEAWRGIKIGIMNLKGKVAWVVGNGNCISMGLDACAAANNNCVSQLREKVSGFISAKVSLLTHENGIGIRLCETTLSLL